MYPLEIYALEEVQPLLIGRLRFVWDQFHHANLPKLTGRVPDALLPLHHESDSNRLIARQ